MSIEKGVPVIKQDTYKKTRPRTSHYVYKFVLNDEWIYVGKSDVKTFDRIWQHGKIGDNIEDCGWPEINQSDIYYVPLANKVMSDAIESALIVQHKPKYNKAKANCDWDGIDLSSLKWVPLRVRSSDEVEVLKDKIDGLNKKINGLKNALGNSQRENKKLKKSLFRATKYKVLNGRSILPPYFVDCILKPNKFLPLLTRKEIAFLHDYYPIDGIEFISSVTFNHHDTETARWKFKDGNVIACTKDISSECDCDGHPKAYMFNLIAFSEFYPNEIGVYKLLQFLYSDLLESIEKFKHITTTTVKQYIADNRGNKKPPYMKFVDYDCAFRYMQQDEQVFIHDPENLPYSFVYSKNSGFVDNKSDVDTDDFLSVVGDLQCFISDCDYHFTNESYVRERKSILEETEKAYIENNLSDEYDYLFRQVYVKQSFFFSSSNSQQLEPIDDGICKIWNAHQW